MLEYLYGKRFGSKIAWANRKEGDRVGAGVECNDTCPISFTYAPWPPHGLLPSTSCFCTWTCLYLVTFLPDLIACLTCFGHQYDLQWKPLLHLVDILFPHINDDARSKSHQICMCQNAQAIFEPYLFPHKYSSILKLSHSSYLSTYEDGTDRVFWNGI